MYMPGSDNVTPRFKAHRRTFIRQWREHRGKTLEETARFVGDWTGVGFTHASLSRVERGLQPYSQPILEALAVYLETDEASLIMRDPSDPDGMWSIWDQAKPGERRLIINIAKTVTKTGT
jgi:transcriptional regulator with XRE-family HTH domain